jgi:hypothetical protein
VIRRIAVLTCVAWLASVHAAAAQSTAGGAYADDGPSGTSGAADVQGCMQRCQQEAAQCGSDAADQKGSDAQSRALEACRARSRACALACVPQSNGSSGSVNLPRGYQPDSSLDTDDPSSDDSSQIDANADAAIEQLVASWNERNAGRMARADQVALQAVQQLLQALCRSNRIQAGSCVVAASVLPAMPNTATGRRVGDRWTTAAHARTSPATASSTCPRASGPTVAVRGGQPGAFVRDQDITICIAGTRCSGATSVQVGDVSFSLRVVEKAASGMCMESMPHRNFMYVLMATNNSSDAVVVATRSGSLRTDGMPDWANANNTPPAVKVDAGATEDLVFTSDCSDGTPWGGVFRVNVSPTNSNPGPSVAITSGSNPGGTCRQGRTSSITATAGVVVPTFGGDFHQIQ